MSMKLNIGLDSLQQGTKINEIIVPEHMRRRVSLGIDWVNKLFGGSGTIPSTVTLFTGTPGAGKTTLTLQIADAVAKMSNAIALINTCEESLFQVKMTCERMGLSGFNVGQDQLIPSREDLEENGIHPNVIKNWNKKESDGSYKFGSVIDHAKFLMDSNPGKDLVMLCDSLQTFNDGKYGPDTILAASQVRVVEQLTSFAKQGYKGIHPIIILIGHVTKSGEFAGKQTVKHAVDAHMHLYIDEDKKSETFGRRLIETTKNRFGSCGTKIILDMNSKGLEYGGEYSWMNVENQAAT